MADKIRKILQKLKRLKEENDLNIFNTDKPVNLMEVADLIEKILTLVTYCSIGYNIA